jgi:hypothetical protein
MMVLPHGLKPGAVLLGAGLLGTGLLGGCGSSSGSAQSAPSTVQSTCQEVSAVLSNGPTPGADTVGYAEAQVRPLRRIHTSDRVLAQAIDQLATAYQRFYAADGTGTSVHGGVTSAGRRVDALCPGVGEVAS